MNKTEFYKSLRRPESGVFGGSLTQSQVKGLEAILAECAEVGADLGQAAYILATAYGETGGAICPVRENMNYSARRMRQVWPGRFRDTAHAKQFEGNPRALANHVYNGRLGNRPGTDDGWNFRGAFIGQITGLDNFSKWSKGLGVDLLSNPELLDGLDIAVKGLVRPMMEGWATNRALPEFVKGQRRDYRSARQVWNGVFEAEKYAEFAQAFEVALRAAGYAPGPVKSPATTEAPAAGVGAKIAAIIMALFNRRGKNE